MQLSRLISCCKIHNNLQSGDLEIIEFKPLLHRTGQVHNAAMSGWYGTMVDRSWWVMFGSSFTAEQQQPTVTVHSVVIITSFLLTITVTGLHCDVHSLQSPCSQVFSADSQRLVKLGLPSIAQPRLRLLMGWIKIIIY